MDKHITTPVPAVARPGAEHDREGAYAEEVGRLRSILSRVVALADDAPGLTNEQLRSRLLALADRARPGVSMTTDQEGCELPDLPELVALCREAGDGEELAGWAMVIPETGKVVAYVQDRNGVDTGLASMYSSLDSAERLLSYADLYVEPDLSSLSLTGAACLWGARRPSDDQGSLTPTAEQITAAVEMVRFGKLTYDQRDTLARLAAVIGSAVRSASQLPAGVENRDRWVATCWEPVGDAYVELLAAFRGSVAS